MSKQRRYEKLMDRAKKLVVSITQYCPESRERSMAIAKLEKELVVWANAINLEGR